VEAIIMGIIRRKRKGVGGGVMVINWGGNWEWELGTLVCLNWCKRFRRSS